MKHSSSVDSEAMAEVEGVDVTEMLGRGVTVHLSEADVDKIADAMLAKIERRAFERYQRACNAQLSDAAHPLAASAARARTWNEYAQISGADPV